MIDLGKFYGGLFTIIACVLLGFLLGKKRILNNTTNKALTVILLNIGLPIAFMRSFPTEFDAEYFGLFLWGLGSGFLILTIQILISQVIFLKKFTGRDNYEYKFAFVFNNTSFIGYPLVSTAFGLDGLTAYAGFMTPFVLLQFTYGIWLFKKDYHAKDFFRSLMNPNIIGIAAGAIMFIFSIQLPDFLDRGFGTVAGMTTPLSLICVGFMLNRARFKTLFKRWAVVFVCVVQLVIPSTMTFFITKWIGASAVVISVLTLMQALPTAASLALFAEKYRGSAVADSEAGEIVALSTVLSSVTVPIVATVLLGGLI
jgi:predicted permease